jgi:hypothetical protein
MADAPDWNTATDPDPLIRLVWPSPAGRPVGWVPVATLPRPVARRLRLIAVACTRQVWDLLSTDDRSAVLVSERYADGRASWNDLQAVSVRVVPGPLTHQQYARSAAGCASACYIEPRLLVAQDIPSWDVRDAARYAAKAAAGRVAGPAAHILPANPVWHAAWNTVFHAARAEQAEFVRDVFPPPGTSPAAEPGWLTSTVVALARQMYESRDFSPMSILADALQDAGCADELVLGHCRKPAPHVRGCWVVDLLRSAA